MSLHHSLKVAGGLLVQALLLEGVCAPIKSLLIGVVEMVKNESGIRDYA